MRVLRHHPIRVLVALLAVAFVLFNLSGIPRYRYAKSGPDLVAGDVFWFGFLLAAAGFVLAGGYVIVRSLRGRSLV